MVAESKNVNMPRGHSDGCTPCCYGSTEEGPNSVCRFAEGFPREMPFDLTLKRRKREGQRKRSGEDSLGKETAQAKASSVKLHGDVGRH